MIPHVLYASLCCALFCCPRQVGSVQIRLVSTYANKDKNATTADEVNYVYTIENNGLLTLYNIAVQAEGLVDIVCVNTDGDSVSGSSPGRVEDLAGYPSDGLAPAGSLICSATGRVSQAEVMHHTLREWARLVWLKGFGWFP